MILAETILRTRDDQTSEICSVILDEAFQIGRRLVFAHAKMSKGAFREWLRAGFLMEPEIADRYMELARNVAISRDSVLPADLGTEVRAGKIPLRGEQ